MYDGEFLGWFFLSDFLLYFNARNVIYLKQIVSNCSNCLSKQEAIKKQQIACILWLVFSTDGWALSVFIALFLSFFLCFVPSFYLSFFRSFLNSFCFTLQMFLLSFLYSLFQPIFSLEQNWLWVIEPKNVLIVNLSF